jgi:purine-binding chemotaxis protein CheW
MSTHASAARALTLSGDVGVSERAPRAAAGAFLLCQVGTLLCALPLESVVETMRPLPIEALAAALPFVRGTSIIRGMPVPVVDAGRLIADEVTVPGRYVSLRAGGQLIALAVSGVLGVRVIGAESLQELPTLLRDARADFVAAIGTLDAQLLLVLRSGRILPEILRHSPDSAEPDA